MSFFEEHTGKVVSGLIGLVIAGFTWLVRTVFTNKQELAVLKEHLRERDARRDEDRERVEERIAEVRQDVRDIRSDIRDLASRK